MSQALALMPELKPPPTEDDLPYEDGIPMETPYHRTQMNLLIDLTDQHWVDRTDYYVGGNMFVYFSETQRRNKDYRGPDFFIVKDVDGIKERKSWVVWQEEGRYPDLIIELLSESAADFDKTTKKHLYERTFRTPEYFCYDIATQEFLGWRMGGSRTYEPIEPNENGHMWSDTLQLWLGTWKGVIQKGDITWLRFYDENGNLIATPAEAETERADTEAERADQAEAMIARMEAELKQLRAQRPD